MFGDILRASMCLWWRNTFVFIQICMVRILLSSYFVSIDEWYYDALSIRNIRSLAQSSRAMGSCQNLNAQCHNLKWNQVDLRLQWWYQFERWCGQSFSKRTLPCFNQMEPWFPPTLKITLIRSNESSPSFFLNRTICFQGDSKGSCMLHIASMKLILLVFSRNVFLVFRFCGYCRCCLRW